jgi:hypothetical protein
MAGTTSRSLGMPGVHVEPGDHLCGLYMGQQERDDVLLPYLRAGLHAGDKCLGIVDSNDPASLMNDIGDGIDVRACVESHQLEVWKSTDSYLREGKFTIDRMVEFWEDTVGSAVRTDGFDFVRVFGEMTWSLRGLPGVEYLAEYESELNRFMPRYPQVIVCLYDLREFGGGLLMDLLKTHPKVLLGGLVFENPHYLSPDEYRSAKS